MDFGFRGATDLALLNKNLVNYRARLMLYATVIICIEHITNAPPTVVLTSTRHMFTRTIHTLSLWGSIKISL